MIFWRIRFDEGHAQTSEGYQVMDAGLNTLGIYDDAGVSVTGAVSYHTTDTGVDPAIGVTPPAWAGMLNV